MSSSGRDILLRRLLLDYEKLKQRLANRLGSADRAGDVLHDTWVRLQGANPVGAIHQPERYIFRTAYHLALKQLQKEPEQVTLDDACTALDLPDDTPGPDRVLEGKSDAAIIAQALAELSPRRRAILLASRVDEVPLKDIARQHNISQRMVEIELKLALAHCGRRLGKKIVQRFGPRLSKGSS